MCEEVRNALERGKGNIEAMAGEIEALPIPRDFKGVFIDMVANRGLQLNKQTIGYMQIIGESNSGVCLTILEGNHKRAGLIAAYRLSTELQEDRDRAKVVQWIRDELGKKTIDEKSVLLGILHVKGGKG